MLGSSRPRTIDASVLSAAAARAHEHHRLAGQKLEVDPVEHAPGPRRIAVRDVLEVDDRAIRRRRCAVSSGADNLRRLG